MLVSRKRGRPLVLANALSLGAGAGGSRSCVSNLLAALSRDARRLGGCPLAGPGALEGMDARAVQVRELRAPRRGRGAWGALHEQALLPLRARRFDPLYRLPDLSPPFGSTPAGVLVPTLESYDRRTRMWERLARWGVPRARRILLPSRAAPDLIAARIPIPARRVRVVPDSVSLEALHDLWPVEGRSRYLLLAAAPERHKNVSILVECLPLVEDRELEVWVAGTSLLDPGHRLELERRGRARAAEFSWARSVARLCEVLQEAAGG